MVGGLGSGKRNCLQVTQRWGTISSNLSGGAYLSDLHTLRGTDESDAERLKRTVTYFRRHYSAEFSKIFRGGNLTRSNRGGDKSNGNKQNTRARSPKMLQQTGRLPCRQTPSHEYWRKSRLTVTSHRSCESL